MYNLIVPFVEDFNRFFVSPGCPAIPLASIRFLPSLPFSGLPLQLYISYSFSALLRNISHFSFLLVSFCVLTFLIEVSFLVLPCLMSEVYIQLPHVLLLPKAFIFCLSLAVIMACCKNSLIAASVLKAERDSYFLKKKKKSSNQWILAGTGHFLEGKSD